MIYFITAREIGRVKIGFSDQPWDRLQSLQTSSPAHLMFERIDEGDKTHELALHMRFRSSRVVGEWFSLTLEIEKYMENLQVPSPLIRRVRNMASSSNIDALEVRQRAADALITMDSLFELAGVSPSTFWRWEKDKCNPSLLTIAKLRQALQSIEQARAA